MMAELTFTTWRYQITAVGLERIACIEASPHYHCLDCYFREDADERERVDLLFAVARHSAPDWECPPNCPCGHRGLMAIELLTEQGCEFSFSCSTTLDALDDLEERGEIIEVEMTEPVTGAAT
jgi:hypothetical protein